MSSRVWPARRRVSTSLKKPARQSMANWDSASAGRAGMAGADWSAGSIEECQSQHVPMRSKISALGLEGFGAADAIWAYQRTPNTGRTCGRKRLREIRLGTRRQRKAAAIYPSPVEALGPPRIVALPENYCPRYLDLRSYYQAAECTQPCPRNHNPTYEDEVFQEPSGCSVMEAKSGEGGEIQYIRIIHSF